MRKDAAVRRQQVLELALEGLGPRAIAERLQLTDRAIRNYLNTPETTADLRRLQDARLRQLTRRALAASETALTVLQAVAQDPEQPAAARVASAKALLDVLTRLLETTDVVERLEALEAAAARPRIGPPNGSADRVLH